MNFGGTSGQLPSGTQLTNTQTAVLLDTTGGASYVVGPTGPADGQPLTIKDPPPGHYGVQAGALQCPAGIAAELPSNPGTLSATGALVTCFPQPGGATTWSYSTALSAFLLD